MWLRKLVLSWSSLEFSPVLAWLLCREHGQAALPLLLLEPFSTWFAHWLRTAALQPVSVWPHHTDCDFSTTVREPGINGKKGLKILKSSHSILGGCAGPNWCSVAALFPRVPASLFKDGISVLQCILQHQHTHCLWLLDSSCAQGNRILQI